MIVSAVSRRSVCTLLVTPLSAMIAAEPVTATVQAVVCAARGGARRCRIGRTAALS